MPYESKENTCASDIGAGRVLFEGGQITQHKYLKKKEDLPASIHNFVNDSVMRNGLSVHILS